MLAFAPGHQLRGQLEMSHVRCLLAGSALLDRPDATDAHSEPITGLGWLWFGRRLLQGWT